jgi:hypothetical protein
VVVTRLHAAGTERTGTAVAAASDGGRGVALAEATLPPEVAICAVGLLALALVALGATTIEPAGLWLTGACHAERRYLRPSLRRKGCGAASATRVLRQVRRPPRIGGLLLSLLLCQEIDGVIV